MARKTPRKGRGKGGRGPSRKTIPAQRRLADKAARKPTRGRKSAPKAVAQKIVAHRKTSVFARAPLKFKTRNQYENDLILNSKVKKLRDDLKEMGVYGYTKGKKGDVVKILGGIKFFDRKMPSRSRSGPEQKEYIERYNNKACKDKCTKIMSLK